MFGYKGCQSKQEKLGMGLCSAAVAIGHEGDGFEKQLSPTIESLAFKQYNTVLLEP